MQQCRDGIAEVAGGALAPPPPPHFLRGRHLDLKIFWGRIARLVSHAGALRDETNNGSPQTAAETWTTFLHHCVCDKFSEPITHQQNENDVSFRAKKRPVVSGLHVPDILAQNRIFLGVMADETPKKSKKIAQSALRVGEVYNVLCCRVKFELLVFYHTYS